ncbi:MAG TPA: hypothetical protein VGN81_01570 [Pseudonocardiaceae bacterium]|jgi:hypothetical protein
MHEPVLVKVLITVIAVLVSVICAGIAGFLKYLDGASAPSALLRAGAAFCACLTASGVAIGFLLG